ncbi:MAG: hypothetical protein ACKVPX_18190 [Myxococcaceae bacterium]
MDFDRVLRNVADFLEREGVAYALAGGLALQAHGMSRATFDVDLVLVASEQGKLVAFVESLGYATLHRSPGFSNHVHQDTALGRLDFIYVDAETGRKLLAPTGVEWKLSNGKSIQVPRPEHLIAMKVHAAKNDPQRLYKELADIQFLLGLPGVDTGAAAKYFREAGMEDKLDELKRLR